MKKEELVIKNTLQMTKEADEHLSIYATKNSDCIKIKQTIKDKEEFDIRWPFEEDIDRILYCNHISVMSIKHKLYPFFAMLISLNVQFMFNGLAGLQDKLVED